jgi:hypothetical protein
MMVVPTPSTRRPNSTARTDYSRIGRIERRVRRALIIRGKPMSTTELPTLSTRRPNIPVCPDRPRVGRIQRQIRRLLIIHERMTTSELARHIYPRPTQHWQRKAIRGAARKFAVEYGRRRSPGVPIIWRLK